MKIKTLPIYCKRKNITNRQQCASFRKSLHPKGQAQNYIFYILYALSGKSLFQLVFRDGRRRFYLPVEADWFGQVYIFSFVVVVVVIFRLYTIVKRH